MPAESPKILIVGINYGPEKTGIAPYTTAMSVALARRGFSVDVVTTHPHYPDWIFLEPRPKWTQKGLVSGVKVTRVFHYLPRPPKGLRRLASELSFGLRAAVSKWANPAVIVFISPALFSTFVALLRAKIANRGARKVVWVQDFYGLGVVETGQGSSVLGWVISRLESWVFKSADQVIVIHDKFGATLERHYGVPKEKIVVIRNWSHIETLETFGPQLMRARYGWTGKTLVLHTGNIGIKQGLENVVYAARLAESKNSSIHFGIVGDGSEKERLMSLAEGCKNISFTAPVASSDYFELLASAHFLLVNELPELSEMAVPSKLTSYFAAGKPVVAVTSHDSTTAHEINGSGGGVVVEPGKPDALLDAIERLAEDPALAETLAANGLRYRSTNLSEEQAVERFVNLILYQKRTKS